MKLQFPIFHDTYMIWTVAQPLAEHDGRNEDDIIEETEIMR